MPSEHNCRFTHGVWQRSGVLVAQLPGLSSQLVQEETGWEAWDQIKVNLTKLWIPSVTRKLESLGSFLNGIITEWDVCGWINLLFNPSQAVLRQLWLSNSTCLISFYLRSLLSPFLFSPQSVMETKMASYLLSNEVNLESTSPIFLPLSPYCCFTGFKCYFNTNT